MLSDVIAELRGRIITQRLAPGSRLRERQLAEDLGVSRAVIRDALSNLAERRLVVRFPGPSGEVENTFDFKHPIECESVSAKWNSGVLWIVLPKKRGRRITIE